MISFYETESEARQALSDVTLIKWPQMIVTGASVTREQAKEIIIRTDPFFRMSLCMLVEMTKNSPSGINSNRACWQLCRVLINRYESACRKRWTVS